MHESLAPSPWVTRHAALIAAGSSLLDVACGSGRHARFFAARGVRVTAVDRDETALASLADHANIAAETRDLETTRWPYPPQSFDAVVVVNYLWRPHISELLETVRSCGLLIYETFMVGNEKYGRPSREEFLLRSNELIDLTGTGFEHIEYEEGPVHSAQGDAVVAVKAKLVARRR